MARQFGRPTGLAGRLVTRLLARGNAGFNHWLVCELAALVPPPSTVIELGCGPGMALQQMLTTYPYARIIGIDLSPIALKGARRHNAAAVEAGRLELVTGDTSSAAFCGPADLIVACHVLYFWTHPVMELQRIRNALTPTGHLALGYQLRDNMPPASQRGFATEGFSLYDSDEQLAAVLTQAGFHQPEIRVFGDHDRPQGRLALASFTDRC